jgi:hypothetical protein
MSSFFDEASLVMIPSGYKDQKVYSVKPLDGSGDLTFSRASSATRVASNGLIEKVRTNLVLQSETFDNASWTKLNSATVTANTSVAPDGTTTADTLTLTTNISSSIAQTITTVSELTFSVYAKVASGTKNFRLRFDRPSVISSADFTATTTWQRFTFTATTTGSGSVYIINDSTGTAGDLIIWGAQLETGDIATDYIATTTAAVSVGPVSGLPRLDYLNSSCPRLLLEPQRTNIALFSEQFDNADYVKSNTTVTANATTSPDGYANADKLIPTATSGFHSVDILPSVIVTTYTLSVFAKAGEYSKIALLTNNRGSNMARGFDLTNGTTFANDFGYSEPTSFAITNYGNGWYRCSITYPKTSTGTSGNGIAVVNDAGATTFAGNGTDGLFVYGFQMELAASYPSSYIPTLSTSVTRVADSASKTGIASLIGQTEGTIYAEFTAFGGFTTSRVVINLNSGGTVDFVAAFYLNEIFNARIRANGGSLISVTKSGLAEGTHKVAVAYAANDLTMYIDGVLVGQNTGASVSFASPLNEVAIGENPTGAEQLGGTVSQALVFPTRLTNAQLAELTTL